jgi:hypothetical protein
LAKATAGKPALSTQLKPLLLKAAAKNALTPAGRFISVDDRLPRFRRDDLIRLKELAEAGRLKPAIDRR